MLLRSPVVRSRGPTNAASPGRFRREVRGPASRRRPGLPVAEAEVERLVAAALGSAEPAEIPAGRAPRSYRTWAPVPILLRLVLPGGFPVVHLQQRPDTGDEALIVPARVPEELVAVLEV